MANPEHVAIVRAGKEAIAEWRVENPGVRLDLSGANLHRADLNHADLTHSVLFDAILTEANVSGARLWASKMMRIELGSADLSGVTLNHANLSDAKLVSAQFFAADLSCTNLTDADAGHANLLNANLNRAVLNRAKFASSICGHTVWTQTDLSVAECLDSIDHRDQSEIGYHTLALSRGRIPESFLRGCGLSDEFIQYIPSLFGDSAFQFYSCFISYSHNDKQFARQLHDRLQGQGIRCWLDEHEINPGDDIYDRVDRGIRVWDKVLLCCSEHSLNSWWVDREINTAIEKEQEFHRDRGERVLKIIPLNLDGSLFDWEHSQASEIRRRLAADFTDWKSDADKFEREFEKVVRALRTDGGGSVEPVGRL